MEKDYLNQVKRFYSKYKRLPSFREMKTIFGLASTNAVSWIVHKWIQQGLMQMENKRLSPTAQFFRLPLLGVIKAGTPTSEEQEMYESVSLDEYLVGNPGFTYLLRVSGDSMIEEGINPDDLVIIDKKREPKNGDVVAACVDGEWTIKYYKNDNGSVYLMPANIKYKPILPNNSLNIGGVVVSVIRKYY
ncbi:MAG: hypothetical protein RI947_449 [Candidatus Parcubacteria bacterium]|jgi:repressor LexA